MPHVPIRIIESTQELEPFATCASLDSVRPKRLMALVGVALLFGAGVIVINNTRDAPEHPTATGGADRKPHPAAIAPTSNSPPAHLQPVALATNGREPADTTNAVVAQQSIEDAQSDFNPTRSAPSGGPAGTVASALTTPATTSTPTASAPSPNETPIDWFVTGSNIEGYTLQTNRLIQLSGRACAALISIPDADPYRFGALAQTASARDFVGKRLELSGYIAANGAPAGASIWLRADAGDGTTVGFENTVLRGIRGTQDWSYQHIVMDIPAAAAVLMYGAVLNGPGTLYVDDLQFRIVDASMPVTAKPIPAPERSSAPVGSRTLPAPRNLDFEQTRSTESAR